MRTLKPGPNGSFIISYSDALRDLSQEIQLGSMRVYRYPDLYSVEFVEPGASPTTQNLWRFNDLINGTTGIAFQSYGELDAWISANAFLAPGSGGGGGGGTVGGALETTQQLVKTAVQSIDTKTPTVGQKAAAASSPVVLASDQPAIPVNVTFPGTQPISGNVGITGSVEIANDQGNPLPVSVGNFPATQAVTGTFFQATQPVSIAATVPISASALPLPAGAATSAKQDTQITAEQAIQAGIGTPADTAATEGGYTGSNSLIALWKLAIAGILATRDRLVKGQNTKANSLSVTLASDQGSISVTSTGTLRTEVDGSGSIITGGTAQQAAAANPSGQILKIQNLSSEVLWISFTNTTPSALGTGCFSLAAYANGGSGYYETPSPITNALYIFGATTGSKYTLLKS